MKKKIAVLSIALVAVLLASNKAMADIKINVSGENSNTNKISNTNIVKASASADAAASATADATSNGSGSGSSSSAAGSSASSAASSDASTSVSSKTSIDQSSKSESEVTVKVFSDGSSLKKDNHGHFHRFDKQGKELVIETLPTTGSSTVGLSIIAILAVIASAFGVKKYSKAVKK